MVGGKTFAELMKKYGGITVTTEPEPYKPSFLTQKPSALSTPAYVPSFVNSPQAPMSEGAVQRAKNEASNQAKLKTDIQTDVLNNGGMDGKTADDLAQVAYANNYRANLAKFPAVGEGSAHAKWRQVLDPDLVDTSKPYYSLLQEQVKRDISRYGGVSNNVATEVNWFKKHAQDATIDDIIKQETHWSPGSTQGGADLITSHGDRSLPGAGFAKSAVSGLDYLRAATTSAWNVGTSALHKSGLDKGLEGASKGLQVGAPVGAKTISDAADSKRPTVVNYLGVDPETFQSNGIGFKEGINRRIMPGDVAAQTAQGAHMMANGITGSLYNIGMSTLLDPLTHTRIKINQPGISYEKAVAEGARSVEEVAAAAGPKFLDGLKKQVIDKAKLEGRTMTKEEVTAEARDIFSKTESAAKRDALLAEKAGNVEFKMLGGSVKSKAAYDFPATLWDKIIPERAKSGVGQMFNAVQQGIPVPGTGAVEQYRTPAEAYLAERTAKATVLPMYTEAKKRIEQGIAGLNENDWSDLMHARSHKLTIDPQKMASTGLPLSGYKGFVDQELASQWEQLRAAHNWGDITHPQYEGYFPAYFKKETLATKAWEDGRKSWINRSAAADDQLHELISSKAGTQEVIAQQKLVDRLTAEGDKYSWDAFKNVTDVHGKKLAIISPTTLLGDAKKAVQATGQHSFISDFVGQFGKPARLSPTGQVLKEDRALMEGSGMTLIGPKMGKDAPMYHYLDGPYWIPKGAENTLKLSGRTAWDAGMQTELAKLTSGAMQWWKWAVTAPNPSHHINNIIGDITTGFYDGVNSPGVYKDSMLAIHKPDYKIWLSPTEKMSASDFAARYKNSSAAGNRMVTELGAIYGPTKGTNLVTKGINGAVEGLSQLRGGEENWTRMAHMISATRDELRSGKTLDEAFNNAIARVVRFKHDYGAVTQFERKVSQSGVPFYTWLRKNIPLQFETMLLNPGKANAIFRSADAIQSVMDKILPGDPTKWITDAFIPDYMQPVAETAVKFGNATDDHGQYFAAPNLPINDLFRWMPGLNSGKGIAKELVHSLNPVASVPLESALQHTLGDDRPVGSLLEQIMRQTPITNTIQGFRDSSKTDSQKYFRFLNVLLGGGLHEQTHRSTGGAIGAQRDESNKQLAAAKRDWIKRHGH